MNKNKKLKKFITKSKRNSILNRRYLSTLKTLMALFLFKKTIVDSFSFLFLLKVTNLDYILLEFSKIFNMFYSAVDKAVKKGALHKKVAARMKSILIQNWTYKKENLINIK